MKQKMIWILITLMLLGWSASLQATNAPEDSWRYLVMLNGQSSLKLEIPCYDRDGVDSWVKEGTVYIQPTGGTKETLFWLKTTETYNGFGGDGEVLCPF